MSQTNPGAVTIFGRFCGFSPDIAFYITHTDIKCDIVNGNLNKLNSVLRNGKKGFENV